MEKCRRMKRQEFLSKNWKYSLQWKSSRIRQEFYRSESFATNKDTHTSGSPVRKPHLQASQRVLPQACPLQHPWHLQGKKLIILGLPQAHLSDSGTQAREDLCHSDIREWLQEFRENLVDDRAPAHRDSHASPSHELSLEPTFKRREDLCTHSFLYSFPYRPKLRDLPVDKKKELRAEDAMAEPYLVLTNLVTWWQQKRQLRISKQSSICSRGARSSHSMDPGVSVQNKNFTRNPAQLAKVPGAREETKSHLYSHSARRYICNIVANRSGWELVGRFHGVWNLSAKNSGSLIWWEDALWKTFWAAI